MTDMIEQTREFLEKYAKIPVEEQSQHVDRIVRNPNSIRTKWIGWISTDYHPARSSMSNQLISLHRSRSFPRAQHRQLTRLSRNHYPPPERREIHGCRLFSRFRSPSSGIRWRSFGEHLWY